MKKLLIFISFLILFIYLTWSYLGYFKSGAFRLIFFDVGQGDSSLIITPGGQTILIDGGPDKKVLRGLGSILPFWRRTIDLLVITHAHDDHVTGLIEVSRRYKIKSILYNNLDFDTPALNSLLKITQNNKIKMIKAQAGMSFNFDNDCILSILASSQETQKNENDYSIVTKFNCLGKNILSSGDAGIAIENNLLNQGLNLKADIFKIPHHGSNSASSLQFLEAIKPQVVVISVGKNNSFGHPAPLTLDRLNSLPVDIYRTDINSQLEFLVNYTSIRLIK